jgi:hypothetical protein
LDCSAALSLTATDLAEKDVDEQVLHDVISAFSPVGFRFLHWLRRGKIFEFGWEHLLVGLNGGADLSDAEKQSQSSSIFVSQVCRSPLIPNQQFGSSLTQNPGTDCFGNERSTRRNREKKKGEKLKKTAPPLIFVREGTCCLLAGAD